MAENTMIQANSQNNEVTSTEATREPERYVTPAVDIYETKGGLTVLADLPGVPKDRLDVSVEDNLLTIKGAVEARDETGHDWHEFNLVSYFRQFQLGEKIDREKIKADYRHGVLRLSLPFAEEAKPRQIAVQYGG